jgi:protein SCO1/2
MVLLAGAHTNTQNAGESPGGDFTLTDQDGKPFHLASHRGKTILLFFGYTSCPDACPAMLSKLAGVYKKLEPGERDQVLTVFISVDPQRDTPETLKQYLHSYGIGAVGLTGGKAGLDRVVAEYGAKYSIESSESALEYHIRHTTDLYLIDRDGKLSQTFSYTEDPAVILSGLKRSILASHNSN